MTNDLSRRGFILAPFAVLLAACIPKKHACVDLTDFDEAVRIGKQHAEYFKAHSPNYIHRHSTAERERQLARAIRIEQRMERLIRDKKQFKHESATAQEQRFMASWSASGVSA